MNSPVRSAGNDKTNTKFRILKGFNKNILQSLNQHNQTHNIYSDLFNPLGVIFVCFTILTTDSICGYSRLTTSWFDVAKNKNSLCKGFELK